ncbi:MAG: threonine aldolase [Alphaproteobacteria bacterium]|nr:threonine aldolase [Alphaproteobacteria bacterium]
MEQRTPAEKAAIRRRCTRILALDPPHPAAALAALADYARDSEADYYAEGALAAALEARVAGLLGKEAALFVPTGTMAQLIALKVLTLRAGCRRVAMHPRSHFEEHEHRAYRELWGLDAVALGGYDRLPLPADLDTIAETLGAVTLELPLRRLGCLLNPWEDLIAFAQSAKARRTALHLDGARIWEMQPFYGRPYAEIAALFDTVYAAFDKGLGALAGCVLAGPADFIAEARLWRHRAGGRMLRSYPYLLSAMQALDDNLQLMPALHERACAIAGALASTPGLVLTPNPPHANAMLAMLPGDPAAAMPAALDLAEATGVWLLDRMVECPIQGMVMFEITVRPRMLEIGVGEVRDAVAGFAERLAARSRRG